MAEASGESDITPPPEAVLIRRHRLALGLSIPKAAAGTHGAVSATRWAQIEQGYLIRHGRRYPTTASDGVLAHMASIVGVAPEQLQQLGKAEAAHILRTIEDRRQPAVDAPPDTVRMAAYFANPNVPEEERQAVADLLFRLLPYFMRGEQPPPDLLANDHNGAGNGAGNGRETA